MVRPVELRWEVRPGTSGYEIVWVLSPDRVIWGRDRTRGTGSEVPTGIHRSKGSGFLTPIGSLWMGYLALDI